MVTDKIGDLITRLKNGNRAKKDSVSISNSKLKEAVAEALARSGFVKSVSTSKDGKMLDIALAYNQDKTPKITDVKRISKPSRRIYRGFEAIKPGATRVGLVILSTPKGILSNKEAHKEKVGGEAMFQIW
jgi:small subunit ribosomal protein S8